MAIEWFYQVDVSGTVSYTLQKPSRPVGPPSATGSSYGSAIGVGAGADPSQWWERPSLQASLDLASRRSLLLAHFGRLLGPLECDTSSVTPSLVARTETIPAIEAEGASDDFADDVELDVVVRMPPKRRFTIYGRIDSVTRGKPVVVVPDFRPEVFLGKLTLSELRAVHAYLGRFFK